MFNRIQALVTNYIVTYVSKSKFYQSQDTQKKNPKVGTFWHDWPNFRQRAAAGCGERAPGRGEL